MSDKELAELLRYSSSKELYIVTWNNLLKLLLCPFKVIVLKNVGMLAKGQKVIVDEVKITQQLKTVYVINGDAYFYYYFDIIIE